MALDRKWKRYEGDRVGGGGGRRGGGGGGRLIIIMDWDLREMRGAVYNKILNYSGVGGMNNRVVVETVRLAARCEHALTKRGVVLDDGMRPPFLIFMFDISRKPQ